MNPGSLLAAARSPAGRRTIWALLVFGLLLIPHIGLRNYVFDDSYIQVRIARNLIEHGQPYYNPGEAVNGSSSPIWTIIVALGLLAGNFQLTGLAVLSAAISTASVFAFLAFMESQARLNALTRVLLGTAYLGIILPSSIGWMETSFGLLVMWLAFLRYEQGKPAAFVLFGLLPFIRLEFAALYLLVLGDALLRKKMGLLKVAAASLAGAAPMLLYLAGFFGTIVPNTIIAKSAVYRLSHFMVFIRMLRTFLPNLAVWDYLSGTTFPISMVMLFLAMLPFAVYAITLGAELLPAGPRPRPVLALILAIFSSCVMGAYLLERALTFPWYLPLYLVPFLAGQFLLIQRSPAPLVRKTSAILAGPALVVWILAFIQIHVSAFHPVLFSDFIPNARTRAYLQIGEDLYRKYPQARIMASEIGGLGYAFPGYILDGVGLVTPSALKYHPLQVPEQRDSGMYGAIPARFIEETHPEIIVSLDIFVRDFLRSGDKSDYVLFQEPIYLPEDQPYAGEDLWGAEHIDVYIRRDLLAQSAFP